jgi:hypothetical protein
VGIELAGPTDESDRLLSDIDVITASMKIFAE